MNTFDVVVNAPFFPGYLIWLGALVLFALIVVIVQLAVASKIPKHKEGRYLAMGMGIFIFFFGGFVGLVGTAAAEQSAHDQALVQSIEAKGYTHVDLDSSDNTFVASDHGKYVTGTTVSKGNEHYLVFVK